MVLCLHKNKKHPLKNQEGLSLCSMCSKPYKDWSKLFSHIRRFHFDYAPHACPHPGCIFTHDKPYEVKRHAKSVHSNDANFLECDECNKRFPTDEKLWLHKRIMHTQGPFFQCDRCDKGYKNRKLLRYHFKVTHENGSFFCEVCGKEFTNELTLKRHANFAHAKDEPSECNICGEICPNKNALRNHKRRHNNKSGQLKIVKNMCKFCGKGFQGNRDLIAHEKSVHLGIKEILCDQCDYKTHLPYKLKKHKEIVHLGIVYTCDVLKCGKSYTTRAQLYQHQMKVHNIPKPKAACQALKKAQQTVDTHVTASDNT